MIGSLGGAADALRRVVANPDIRRAELAWMLGWAAEWAWLVALLVFTYNAGGVVAVGVLGLARTVPAAVLAPVLSTISDRLPRHRVLLGVHAGRAALIGLATGAVALGWSEWVVFLVAPLDALLAVLHRPTNASMLPGLARSPEELVAANVASSTVENLGILAGPAVGGLLVASTAPAWWFAAPCVGFLAAAVAVTGIRPTQELRRPPRPSILDTVAGGFRVVRAFPHAGSVVGLFAAQTLVRGLLSVMLVVASVELLGLGEEGVGFLNAAFGAGGFLGALATMVLVGRSRLAGPFRLGLLLWGVPILLLGLLPNPLAALAFLAVVGIGNAVLDVAGFTMLQRGVPNAFRGRIFGVLEALVMLTVGVGSALAPVLIAAVSIRGALLATGLLLPVVALLSWREVAIADARAVIPARELALLRGVPMLAPLPMTVLEQVADDLVPLHFGAGDQIIGQGEVGNRFYILAEGAVEVRVSGQAAASLGPGDSFGEIALLRDVPRTATVRAADDVTAYALDREEFVCAVTGDRQSKRAADAVIAERLGAAG
jgi:predicted MFS family arabinose efflux permease